MSRVAIFTDSASDLGSGRGAASGHPRRAAHRQLRVGDVQGRRGPDDRGVLGPDDRARRAVPDDRRLVAGRLQGGLRGGLRGRRRGDRVDPRRRARCPARSRAPRSPGTCCPTARSTSSTRRARRWPRASCAGWGSSCRRADGPAEEIADTLEERAQDPHLPDPRHPRVPQEGRPDQRRPGGHRDAPVGQADHRGQARRGRDGRPGADPGKARERIIELT